MKKNEVKNTVKENTAVETKTAEVEVKQRVKRVVAEEFVSLNKALRELRKVSFMYVKHIIGMEKKDEYMKRMIDSYAALIVKLNSMQGEIDMQMRISIMSETEKEILRRMLNETATPANNNSNINI